MEKENLKYITLPSDFNLESARFKYNSTILTPILLKEGKTKIEKEDLSPENVVAGLITVIGDDKNNPNFNYYKSFLLALEPDIRAKLNTASLSKAQRGEYDFALSLMKSVHNLEPTVDSCITLASIYSSIAAKKLDEEEEIEEELKLIKETLNEGLLLFGENEDILYELASFSEYEGESDEALNFSKRYLSVAEEGERKEKIKKMVNELETMKDNESLINEAYDFILLDEPDKALPIIEKIISSYPNLWNGHFLKGWALRIKKEYKEAKEEFLLCMKMGECNSEIYNELAICELEGGNKDLALAYLETAHELDEKNINILTNLSLLYLENGQFSEARESLEKARYLAKDDKLVRTLIDKYEEITGDKIGKIIHEDYMSKDKIDKEEGRPIEPTPIVEKAFKMTIGKGEDDE